MKRKNETKINVPKNNLQLKAVLCVQKAIVQEIYIPLKLREVLSKTETKSNKKK